MSKNLKIIILGAPGSGKGTIAEKLVKQHNILHLSTGEIFREELSNKGPLFEKINSYLEKGDLVPDEITNELVKKKLKNIADSKNIILDGYPRNIEQAKFLDTFFKVDYAIYLKISDDIVIKRILGRMTCPTCNKIYNEHFMIPKEKGICDIDKTILVKRSDDNEETIKNRLKNYYESTFPLVEFYENKNCLFEMDSGIESDEVVKNLEKKISF
ncbi:MAG: adenylate kinase family protein [Mycoplasmoidaceae bacterium]